VTKGLVLIGNSQKKRSNYCAEKRAYRLFQQTTSPNHQRSVDSDGSFGNRISISVVPHLLTPRHGVITLYGYGSEKNAQVADPCIATLSQTFAWRERQWERWTSLNS